MKNIKKVFGFVATALIISLPCYAQEWAMTYGGDEHDTVYSIQQTTDGGYIVAGATDSFEPAEYGHLWVFKLNPDGTIAWEKVYNGSHSHGRCIRQTADGGYIIVGMIQYYGVGIAHLPIDIWVLKLYPDDQPNPGDRGVVEWQKVYGETYDDRAYTIQQTINQQGEPGGYIMAGIGTSFDSGMWILKLDDYGNVTWQKTYYSVVGHTENSIQQTFNQQGDPDGYIVTGAYSYPMGGCGNNIDFWVTKLNLDGTIAWQKSYGYGVSETDDEWGSSIRQTTDGGYIVAGLTLSVGAGLKDVLVLRLNAGGDVIWQKAYGGSDWELDPTILQTVDGNYVLTCSTRSFGAGAEDIWVLKLDSTTGNIIWQKAYGGNIGDSPFSIQQTTDGDYVVAGLTLNFGPNPTRRRNAWILKLNANGEIPGCNKMRTSEAVVTDTLVEAQDTTEIPDDPVSLTDDTNALSQGMVSEVSVVCSTSVLPTISQISPRQQEPTVPYPYMASWLSARLGYTVTNPRWGRVGIYGDNFGSSRMPGDEVRIGDPLGPDVLNYNIDGDYYTVEDINDGIGLKIGPWRNDLVGVYLFPAEGEIVPALYGPGSPGLGTMWLDKWLGLWVVKGNGGVFVASNVKPIKVRPPLPD